MSPKLALKILFFLIIIAVIAIFSFYIADKLFLERFERAGEIMKITEDIREKNEIKVIEYTEEERRETAVKEIREIEDKLIKKDLEESGKITSTTARSIEDMINEEIRKQKESGL